MNRRRGLLLILLAVLLAAGYWLLGTAAGLQWVWGRVQAAAGGTLSAARVEGHLAGRVQIDELTIRTAAATLQTGQLVVDWDPLELLTLTFSLSRLEARPIQITLHPSPDEPAAEPTPFPAIFLPLAVEIERLDLVQVDIVLPDHGPIHLQAIGGAVHASADTLRLDPLTARLAAGSLQLAGQIGLAPKAPLDVSVNWDLRPAIDGLHGEGRVNGTLARPEITQTVRGPVEALIEGRLHWLTQPLRWTVAAQIRRADPQALGWGGGPLQISGAVRGEGGVDAFEAGGQLRLEAGAFGRWRTDIQLSRQQRQWAVPRLELIAVDSPAHLRLSASWRQGAAVYEVVDGRAEAQWRSLAWPPAGAAVAHSPEGRFRVEGGRDAYRLEAEGSLAVEALTPAQLMLRGEGDRTALHLSLLELAWLDGTARGQARLGWQPELNWAVTLSANGVNPGAVAPAWPGRLAGVLVSEGRFTKGQVQARLELQKLAGTLRGYPVDGHLALAAQEQRYRLEALRLASGSARLTASGVLDEGWDAQWALRVPDLAHVWPGSGGGLRAAGRITGERAIPRVTVDAEGSDIALADSRVEAFNLNAQLGLAGHWQGQASARAIRIGPLRLEAARLSTDGQADAHRIIAEAQWDGARWRAQAQGGLLNGQWSGMLQSGRLSSPLGEWSQAAPAALRLSMTEAVLAPWCWRSSPARLCLSGGYAEAQGWSGELVSERFPLGLFNGLWPEGIALSGALSGEVALLYGPPLRRLTADLHAVQGTLRYPLPEGREGETVYRQATLRIVSEDALSAQFGMETADGTVQARIALPDWSTGEHITPSSRLDGAIEARFTDPVWLSLLAPQLAAPKGVLTADLAVSGTLGSPRLGGAVFLEEGALAVTNLGITLEQVRIELETAPDALFRFSAGARSGTGPVRIAGEVGRAQGQWRVTMEITGQGFEAVNLPQARILASPALSIVIEPPRVRVTGRVVVPTATVRLPKLQTEVGISPDVVIVDRPAREREARWRIQAEVELILGDAVRLEGYGFSGRLDGRLAITEPAGGIATAQGELRVAEGKYEAYGQELAITEGRLLFAGGAIDNPAISFRAVRALQDVTVGVRVRGRAKDPELELFSTPPMDESRILAYLVLGRPLATVTSEEAGVLQQAATSLGLAGGGRIAREIAGQFGIEEVEVETGVNGQEASLVLGKYLSPRLYLQYAVGLWEAVNRLRIRYRLSEKWMLEIETGAQSGADFLYTIER